MSKKIVALLAMAVLLVAVAAFAVAESELTIYAPEGVGFAGGSRTASKGLSAAEKATVTPPRGGTVNVWTWYNNHDEYNMKNGQLFDGVRYTVQGNYFRVQVVQGASWLHIYDEPGFGWFSWSMSSNTSTKVRTGRIRVSDSRGTICEIVIKQCCDVEVKSVKQNGSARARVQTSRTSGNSGKVMYLQTGYYSDPRPVKYTRGTIWFHANRPLNTPLYYSVAPYRVMGGTKRIGPVSLDKYIELTY